MGEIDGLIARPDGSVVAGRVAFARRIEGVAPAATTGRDYVLPGPIDLQVNGAGALDVMTASPDAIGAISRCLAREGTTAYLPTAITSALDRIVQVERAVGECRLAREESDGSAAILGLHLEGPFISAQRLGVHPPRMLRPTGRDLQRVLALDNLRLLTIAPELPGALDAIGQAVGRGVAISIGHTDATLEQARAGVAAGATMFTHVFNAMRPLHHREPGVVGAALAPSTAMAAVIPDGVHVHPQVLALIYRARGAAGMVLTTDKVASVGQGGASALAADDRTVARTADGRLAGSLISMLDGMRLMLTEVGASVGEVAQMASTNPAKVLGLTDRGRIEVGARADFIVLDPDFRLKAVFIGGAEVQ